MEISGATLAESNGDNHTQNGTKSYFGDEIESTSIEAFNGKMV